MIPTVLEANGRTVLAQTQGRDTKAAAVDQPKTTEGGWVRDRGVVIEAAFAAALDVSPGDRITLRSLDTRPERERFAAAGPAGRSGSPASRSPRPPPPIRSTACIAIRCQDDANSGLIWLTKADAAGLAPRRAGPRRTC